jgi:hypothetical protein
MIGTMSEKSETVSLQIFVPKTIRTRLKTQAAAEEVDMADLGEIFLGHMLDLLSAGKLPAEVAKAIKSRRADKLKKADEK